MTRIDCVYNYTSQMARCDAAITNYEPLYIVAAVFVMSCFVGALMFITYFKALQKLRKIYIEWFVKDADN